MRDRPEDEDFETRPDAVVPLRQGYRKKPGLRDQRPEDQGDRLRAWLVSGGSATWEGLPYAVPAETDGIQLLSSYYVPEGQTGYVKQIRAAPFKPSVLANAVNVELVPGVGALAGLQAMHSDSAAGFWTTPFGWEGYNAELDGEIPQWVWHLRFIPGDIARVREGLNIPPFSFVNPLSWYLVPNIPVPASGYPNGIPGSTPGSQWGPQRMQRLGSCKLLSRRIRPLPYSLSGRRVFTDLPIYRPPAQGPLCLIFSCSPWGPRSARSRDTCKLPTALQGKPPRVRVGSREREQNRIQ